MKSDKERELWLLKITSEHIGKRDKNATQVQPEGSAPLFAHGNKFRWGAIAVAGMTTASMVFSS